MEETRSKFQRLVQEVQQLDIGLEIYIKNAEYSYLTEGYDEPLVSIRIDSDYPPHESYESSASYFGPRDINIIYTSFNCSVCDYPDVTIGYIKETYNVVTCLEKFIENLKQQGLFYNVDLMQPAARSVASDEYVFVIGLNLTDVRIPFIERKFINIVSRIAENRWYELENNILQHIANSNFNARSDEEFISAIDNKYSGLEPLYPSLLKLRKHLFKREI